jgi:hypothetical protein
MSKTSNQKSNGGNSDRRWTILFVVTALALFALSGWSWWHFVRSNPERTFFAALENSMQTRGVTRVVNQSAGAQSLDQKVQLNLAGDHYAHSSTTIKQEGEVDATVATETISTPNAEFVRYTDITTDQKNTKGEVLDFSQLLNIWGKTETNPDSATGELYGESVLGVVPFGNVNAKDREAIMQYILSNNVYSFDFNQVERRIENGRPVYVYDVTVAPEQYVTMLKQFASAIGMKQLENIDPARYRQTEPLSFVIKADVWGQHFSEIEYSNGARTEGLESYGLIGDILELPKESIPVEELQSKLQEVQTQ